MTLIIAGFNEYNEIEICAESIITTQSRVGGQRDLLISGFKKISTFDICVMVPDLMQGWILSYYPRFTSKQIMVAFSSQSTLASLHFINTIQGHCRKLYLDYSNGEYSVKMGCEGHKPFNLHFDEDIFLNENYHINQCLTKDRMLSIIQHCIIKPAREFYSNNEGYIDLNKAHLRMSMICAFEAMDENKNHLIKIDIFILDNMLHVDFTEIGKGELAIIGMSEKYSDRITSEYRNGAKLEDILNRILVDEKGKQPLMIGFPFVKKVFGNGCEQLQKQKFINGDDAPKIDMKSVVSTCNLL